MNHLKMYESFEYSQKIKDQIKKNNWENGIVKYIIARPTDKDPQLGELNTTDFNKAVEQLNWLNAEYEGDQTYCIFETKTRVLSQEEIDFQLNTKKYNL